MTEQEFIDQCDLSAQTVSGDVRVSLPKSLFFSYHLHSISGDFEGLPPGGNLKEGFGGKELVGALGNPVKTDIRFESVSGGFELEQAEGFGGR